MYRWALRCPSLLLIQFHSFSLKTNNAPPIWRLMSYCIVLYCIVLWDPILMARLDRYRIGIPRELSEIRTQPWLSEGSLTCVPYHHMGPIFYWASTQFHQQCPWYHIMNDMLECYLWASNHQPFDYWWAHHVYNVASHPQTSERLACHWRELCLLAHDNWRCSIQPEIFTHQNFARAGIRSRLDSGSLVWLSYTCYM